MKLFSKLCSLIVILLIVGTTVSATAGSIGVTRSMMTGGHSEGLDTRCMNDGWGIDLEYKHPFMYTVNDWFGVGLTPGFMLTYSRFETAYRETSSHPMSDYDKESGYTATATLRPTVKLWKIRAYALLGIGYDYNEPEGSFDFGMIKNGFGAGVDITENWSLDLSERQFERFDGTFYKYSSATITYTF